MAVNSMMSVLHMAEQMSIPQLMQAIKSGSIDPSVGNMVLHNKVRTQQRMEQAQAVQQPQRPPVAQETMMQAEQQPVQGYAEGGSPASRYIDDLFGTRGKSTQQVVNDELIRQSLRDKYGTQASPVGIFMNQSDEDRAAAKMAVSRAPNMSSAELAQVNQYGLPALQGFDPNMIMPRNPAPFPANPTGSPEIPRDMTPPKAPVQTPTGGGIPAGGGVSLGLAKYDTSGLDNPEARMAALSKQRADEYGADDKATFDEIKGDIGKQRDRIADVDKKNLLMSIMRAGLGAAAGKSQYGLTNIAEGAQEGLGQYIQRDVLNREMENRLAQREQALKMEELMQRKGNKSLADKYGMDAVRLGQDAAQLKIQAAHFDNQNRIGMAGLGIESQRLAQQGAFQNKMLDVRAGYTDALKAQAMARIMKARQDAMIKFMSGPGAMLDRQLQQQYGKDWRQNSIRAQIAFNQARDEYLGAGMPDMDGAQYPHADELEMMGQ